MKNILAPTYIYAFLVFVGFYNYHSYYSHFGIEISSYLTFGELILSFLPLTKVILIGLFGILVAIFYILLIYPINNARNDEENDEDEIQMGFIDKIKTKIEYIKSRLNIKDWIGFIIVSIELLFFIAFNITIRLFLFIFFIHFIDRTIEFKGGLLYQLPLNIMLLLCTAWIVLFDFRVTSKQSIIIRPYLRLFIILLFCFGLITIINRDYAKNILAGNSTEDISFEYNDESITTNKNLKFIGKTEKYIFIRNLSMKENYIYSVEELKLIKTKNINQIAK